VKEKSLDAQIVSLLQQVVDGLQSIQEAIECEGQATRDLIEQNVAWLGERIEDAAGDITTLTERVHSEGCHIQDRLNEVKKILNELPSDIGSYMS